jgi:OmcA/MtrC family decaheme c-type cytochrome
VRRSLTRIALIAILGCSLAACSGTKGETGDTGQAGPPGQPGAPGGGGSSGVPSVTAAKQIKVTINAVTIAADTKATVRFSLRSELDQPLRGLTAANVRFVAAQLRPGTAGRGSEWRAYTTRRDGGAVQANAEPANTSGAVFRDNGDGTYDYTFAKALNAYGPDGATYDPALTHRIGLEMRSSTTHTIAAPESNAPYTFVPASGSTSVFPVRREIVDNDTCFACHDRLEFHGGPRTDVQYCVTCHNPATTDGQAPNNTLDMTVMTHKIHMGNKLTNGYKITGFGNTVYEFGTVQFTQDQRNCQTCHQESDADTPQASNWRTVPYARACGACHDNVNFATGQGHSSSNLPATDDQCLTCHGPSSTFAGGTLRVDQVHRIPLLEASQRYKFNLLGVTNTAPGQRPVIRFSVTDPTNGNRPYNILTDPTWNVAAGGASRLALDIGWNTANYTNRGSGNVTSTTGTPAQPISINPLAISGGTPATGPDASGAFTSTSPVAIPADVTGTITVGIEGHPAADVDAATAGIERIPVTNVAGFFAATGSKVDRRSIVNVRKCDDCHKQLSFHGSNRTDEPQVCAICHNTAATDINRRVAGSSCVNTLGPDDVSIDLKYMIHAIHNGEESKYGACGFGNAPTSFAEVKYPGKLNNCEGCHNTPAANARASYYPVDSAAVHATTVRAGANRASTTDDVAWSPNVAVCSGCHVSTTAEAHMLQNGGSKTLTKNADGTTAGGPIETCGLCHGPGSTADVKEVHKIGSFEFQAPAD